MNFEVGKKAPAFTIETDTEGKFKLSDYKSKKHVVVFFYPKDNTSGCTKEAIEFTAAKKKFENQDAVIIGVSPDSVASHEKFRIKQKLKVLLGADEEKKLCEKYGVWVEKSMYGRKYMGVQRATFLINKDGKFAGIWPKVKVAGHVDEVLQTVKEVNI